MIARLVECSDNNIQYGILIVENASIEEVQNKIYEIKNRFYDNGFADWCVEDVIAEFPKEWECNYRQSRERDVIEI